VSESAIVHTTTTILLSTTFSSDLISKKMSILMIDDQAAIEAEKTMPNLWLANEARDAAT
jgi:hypothetical protein